MQNRREVILPYFTLLILGFGLFLAFFFFLNLSGSYSKFVTRKPKEAGISQQLSKQKQAGI